jgi:Glycosyl hydrolase catalytic core
MPVLRPVRLALLVVLVLLAGSAATASATPRLIVGFYDDPSFRWARQVPLNLGNAHAANASLIHTTAQWSQIAPRRPRNPLNGNDPAYKLSDIDALVRDAPKYGMQIFINISGTPKWANGGKAANRVPRNLADLRQFAQMLAKRYNGATGHGYVAKYSVWNEPNLELFLAPQFNGKKIVSPSIYAKLYASAYRGIKAGNPLAQVAVGETSNRGRDRPIPGVSGSVAPGTFARLLAQAAPKLKFDAWATHPYPHIPSLGPTQKVRYPNVTMLQLPNFEKTLRAGFKRRVPIWITEYGQQTKPELPQGVTRAKQAAFAKQVLRMAAANPDVEMFCWFILRDSAIKGAWKSGLIGQSGLKKPAYAAFSSTARLIDGQAFSVKAGKRPSIKLYVPFFSYQNPVGSTIGMTYRVNNGRTPLAIGQPAPRLARDQSVTFVPSFTPQKGKRYTLVADMNAPSGGTLVKTVTIVGT